MPLFITKQPDKDSESGFRERLIESADSRGARAFIAKDIVEVAKASQVDIFRLAQAGAQIEVATGSSDPQVPAAPEPEPEKEPESEPKADDPPADPPKKK